jgi:hypothetical protein
MFTHSDFSIAQQPDKKKHKRFHRGKLKLDITLQTRSSNLVGIPPGRKVFALGESVAGASIALATTLS